MWLTSMVCQRKQPSGLHVCCVHVRVLRETAAIHAASQTAGPLPACPGDRLPAALDVTQGHFFGRLAPYLERDWRRLVTPAQSRLPRTVW